MYTIDKFMSKKSIKVIQLNRANPYFQESSINTSTWFLSVSTRVLIQFRTLYLDIIPSGFLQLLKPEVSLTGVESRRRGNAGTLLTAGSRSDCLHCVEVLSLGMALFNAFACAPAQRPYYTLTLTVWALRQSLHFIIVSNELLEQIMTVNNVFFF